MIRWNAQSDAELLAATPTDKGAFAAFYRRHVSTVVAFVMSRTGRPELAADIAAEVFAAVLQTPESYEESRGAARSWLFSMASSRLVDAIRRGAVEDRARVRLGMPVLQVSDADLERIEQLAGSAGATCEQLLAGLTDDQREAVRLRVLEERDYSEIAASVGLSEHVIRKRVSRGLKTLRTQLTTQRTQLTKERTR